MSMHVSAPLAVKVGTSPIFSTVMECENMKFSKISPRGFVSSPHNTLCAFVSMQAIRGDPEFLQCVTSSIQPGGKMSSTGDMCRGTLRPGRCESYGYFALCQIMYL